MLTVFLIAHFMSPRLFRNCPFVLLSPSTFFAVPPRTWTSVIMRVLPLQVSPASARGWPPCRESVRHSFALICRLFGLEAGLRYAENSMEPGMVSWHRQPVEGNEPRNANPRVSRSARLETHSHLASQNWWVRSCLSFRSSSFRTYYHMILLLHRRLSFLLCFKEYVCSLLFKNYHTRKLN